jgi:hypothetical protein
MRDTSFARNASHHCPRPAWALRAEKGNAMTYTRTVATFVAWMGLTLFGLTPEACDGEDPVAAVPPPTYALALQPDSIAVLPGTHGTTSLTVTRDPGFTQEVTLIASGVPNGLSIMFDRRPGPLDLYTVTVLVAAGVPSGSHSITIAAQSPGSADRSTTLRLVVPVSHYTFRMAPDSSSFNPERKA